MMARWDFRHCERISLPSCALLASTRRSVLSSSGAQTQTGAAPFVQGRRLRHHTTARQLRSSDPPAAQLRQLPMDCPSQRPSRRPPRRIGHQRQRRPLDWRPPPDHPKDIQNDVENSIRIQIKVSNNSGDVIHNSSSSSVSIVCRFLLDYLCSGKRDQRWPHIR